VGHRADLDDVEKRKFLILPGLELRLNTVYYFTVIVLLGGSCKPLF
jgi:hypothetical protein